MCFINLGTIICQVCGQRVGEQPVEMVTCATICGKFVTKVTTEVVSGECGVCRDAREKSTDLARKVTQACKK
ncbi:Acid trehalase [Fusarium oxysporum f. sp. albedinis]|nr:Acid trehalase [Fusarium oxysporum f. sp. albedinis]